MNLVVNRKSFMVANLYHRTLAINIIHAVGKFLTILISGIYIYIGSSYHDLCSGRKVLIEYYSPEHKPVVCTAATYGEVNGIVHLCCEHEY